MTVDVVVLAGARNDGALKECSPAHYEAEIDVAGHPMVWYVVRALQGVPDLGRVTVVGPIASLTAALNGLDCRVVEGGDSMIESLERGLLSLGATDAVMVMTSDIPLITAQAVSDFIQRCRERQADLYYSVVDRDVNNIAYPNVQRTYVRLKDGTYTGGNVLLVRRTDMVAQFRTLLSQAVALRKHPVRMCRMLGITFLLRLLMGRLSIADIEQRVAELMNINGACIISPFPEIGIDVDKPSDLELVRQVLSSR